MSQVYTRSATLDGDAVVVFVRALCAVSREELDAPAPRLYSLQRLVQVGWQGAGTKTAVTLQPWCFCSSSASGRGPQPRETTRSGVSCKTLTGSCIPLRPPVQVALLNLDGRIRLIWSKLWAVCSAHLVMASCHSTQAIAAQAVDALRTLALRVLERETRAARLAAPGGAAASGLSTSAGGGGGGGDAPQHPQQSMTHSAWGTSEGAVRPFVSVLRLCDDSGVRSMALAAVAHMMDAHARGLGSGWKVVLEALRRAAGDTSAVVYEQVLAALELAVAALYRSPAGAAVAAAAAPTAQQQRLLGRSTSVSAATGAPGHDCYRETLRAVLTAVRNAHQEDEALVAAVQLLVRVGARLAHRPQQRQDQGAPRRTSGPGQHHGRDFASGGTPSVHYHYQAQAPPPAPSAAASGAVLSGQGSLQGFNSLTSQGGGEQRRMLEVLAAPLPSGRGGVDEWALLVEVVAEVAATPDHPRLSNAALDAALELMRQYSLVWGARAWRVLMRKVLAAVAFAVPPALRPDASPAEAAAAAAVVGLPLESISTGFVARVDRLLPLMVSQLGPLAVAAAAVEREQQANGGRRRRLSDDEDDDAHSSIGGASAAGLAGMGSGPVAAGPAEAQADLHRELLSMLAGTCLGWFRHPLEPLARVGVTGLSRLLEATGGAAPLPAPGQSADGSGAGGGPTAEERVALQRGWAVLLPLLGSSLEQELSTVTAFTDELRRRQQRYQALVAAELAGAAGAGVRSTPSSPLRPAPQPGAAGMPTTPAVAPSGPSARSPPQLGSPATLPLRPSLAGAEASAAATLARRLRCRCRMLLLLQRTLADYAARRVMELPWAVGRELVSVLLRNARELMAFNMREELPVGKQQQEQQQHGQGGAPGPKAGSGGHGLAGKKAAKSADGWGGDDGWDDDDGWEEEQDEGEGEGTKEEDGRTEAAGEASGGMAGPPHSGSITASDLGGSSQRAPHGRPLSLASAFAATAHIPLEDTAMELTAQRSMTTPRTPLQAAPATPAAPAASPSGTSPGGAAASGGAVISGARLQLHARHLQLTSATSHESLRPALARMEAEAADACISVLLTCTSSPPAPTPRRGGGQHHPHAHDAQRRQEAMEMLGSFCRYIITTSVAAQSAAPAPHHAASAASPLDPAALDPSLPGSSWDHAVRASVLARAIRVLLHHVLPSGHHRQGAAPQQGAGVADGEGRRLELLPDVLTLLASHQPVVRCAVAEYLDVVLGPRVEQLAAGGAL